MDIVCELAARIARAPQALVYAKSAGEKKLRVMCSYGYSETELPDNWDIPGLDHCSRKSIAIANVNSGQLPRDHPILKAVPKIESLVAFLLSKPENPVKYVLLIFNPDKVVFRNANDFTTLQVLAKVLTEVRAGMSNLQPAQDNYAPALKERGFREEAAAQDYAGEKSAEKFLIKTLVENRRLLARHGFSYIALRSWRAPVKPYQIAALTALKSALPKSFVASVAQEIAEAARVQYGNSLIRNVVPVPCGSSGRDDCLSVQLAEAVARLLDCQFMNVLQSSAEPGSSHPKASAKLKPFKLTRELQSVTLIVDDVVTSGRHIEMAMSCLRSQGVDCLAMVWIAG